MNTWRDKHVHIGETIKHQLLLKCFILISLFCFSYLWFPVNSPTYLPSLPSFLPPFPSQLNVFTSQILISQTSAAALASAPPRQLCSSQQLSLSLLPHSVFCSAWWGHVWTIFSLGLRVIQAQTEGSQTSVHTWDQDRRGHVSTDCPWVCLCVGVSAYERVRNTHMRPGH